MACSTPVSKEAQHWDGLRMSVTAAYVVTAACWCTGAGGSLQVVLEQSLAGSLAGPLHEALRTNFEASLIPAFERATRVSSPFLHYRSCHSRLLLTIRLYRRRHAFDGHSCLEASGPCNLFAAACSLSCG